MASHRLISKQFGRGGFRVTFILEFGQRHNVYDNAKRNQKRAQRIFSEDIVEDPMMQISFIKTTLSKLPDDLAQQINVELYDHPEIVLAMANEKELTSINSALNTDSKVAREAIMKADAFFHVEYDDDDGYGFG